MAICLFVFHHRAVSGRYWLGNMRMLIGTVAGSKIPPTLNFLASSTYAKWCSKRRAITRRASKKGVSISSRLRFLVRCCVWFLVRRRPPVLFGLFPQKLLLLFFRDARSEPPKTPLEQLKKFLPLIQARLGHGSRRISLRLEPAHFFVDGLDFLRGGIGLP